MTKKIKIVFSDFDGTLTLASPFHQSELKSIIFDIFALIRQRGWELVIVSGRPLSWGHFFLSHFPVDASILEGGGVILTKEDNSPIFREDFVISQENIERLENVTKKFIQSFPHLPLSADSWGRKSDRAIDLSTFDLMDEGTRKKNLERVMDFFGQEGISHTISSIHINFWLGDIKKSLGVEYFLKQFRPDVELDECLFFGDALNDESMFTYLKRTIGVSNIKEYLPGMTYHPSIILKGPENEGPWGVYRYLSSVVD